MKIACLGWGSLIWDPRKLLVEKEWKPDGPSLPIEFTRQSDDGRLTLVIKPDSNWVTVLWSNFTTENINIAVESLRSREKTNITKIGVVKISDQSDDPIISEIIAWANKQALDAVVYTNLRSKFREIDDSAPTLDEAIAYLRGLTEGQMKLAEEYINRAPPQINTRYRQAFEKEFGWARR